MTAERGALAILPVHGLPEVRPGDDLAALVAAHATLADGDVVVVAQKVVSKSEGALVALEPGEDVTAARRRVARAQATRVVVETPDVLVVETAHGFVCAAAGVDASNVPGAALCLLPADPDASARALRSGLAERAGVDVAVIVADTFGRPWRTGQVDVAIGLSGLAPLRDERGAADRHGRTLDATLVAVADELAAAADLARGKADGVPVVVVRGYPYAPDGAGSARALRRPAAQDLFRRGRGGVADAVGAQDPGAGTVAVADLARAADAARRVGGPSVTVTARPAGLAVAGPPLDAGAAAGAALAALVDLGYAAARERPPPGDAAAVIVRAGAEPSDDHGR